MSRRPVVFSGGAWLPDNGRLPARAAADLYVTPRRNVEVAFDFLLKRVSAFGYSQRWSTVHGSVGRWRMLDLGAGGGVWGQVARRLWPDAMIHGVELREAPNPGGYDTWSRIDMCEWHRVYAAEPFDLVIGNPPYSLDEEAVRIGLERLRDGGWLMMLLPLTFMTSKGRRDGLFTEYPLRYYAQYSERISWTADGRTPPRDHGLYLFNKGYSGPFEGHFLPDARQK